MIGTRIRGLHHLIKAVEKQGMSYVILWGGRSFHHGMMYCPPTTYGTRQLIFANNALSGNEFNFDIYDTTIRQELKKMKEEYRCLYHVHDQQKLRQFGSEVILLPISFKTEYQKFCEQNKKIVNNFIGKCCSKDDAVPMWLFAACGDKPNLWAWAMKSYFKRSATMHQIMHVISWQDNYPQLTGRLSKGTVTAYNNTDGIMKLFDEIVTLRQGKRANDAINTFNTSQKKLLKSIELPSTRQKMLSRFRTLSPTKQSNFVRKMSTIEDVDEIFRQLSHLVNAHFDWSRDSVVDFIKNAENIQCNIVLDENNLLLVSVDTYDTIKYLAKSTNWCISKNKSYWNNYIHQGREATQYVLFDFNRPEDDEYSIVGFTTDRHGLITHAHSFTNNNMMYGENSSLKRLTSFISDSSSIFSLLATLGIPLKTLMKIPALKFDWNKESCISFLDYSLGHENYLVLQENDFQLVIESSHPNLKYVIGKSATNCCNPDSLRECNGKLLVFFDFDETEESDKMYIASVFSRNHLEEYCSSVINIFGTESMETFDDLLDKFGLPYDIICRSSNKLEQFMCDVSNYHVERLDKWLKDKDVVKNLKKSQSHIHNLFSHIQRSILSGKSMDYLKVLYSNGMILSELDNKEFNQLICSIAFSAGSMFDRAQRNHPITDDEQPNDGRNYHDGVGIGYLRCLDYIFDNETSTQGFMQLSHEMFDLRPTYVADYLCWKLVNLNKVEENYELIYNIISIACRNNNTRVLETLTQVNLTQKSLECVLSLLSTTNKFYKIFDEKYKSMSPSLQASFSCS